MYGVVNILATWPLASSVKARWQGMKTWAPDSSVPDWLIVLGVAVVGIGAASLGWFWISRLRRARAEFRDSAGKIGLTETECKALLNLVRLAKLKDPLAIFTSAEAFRVGQEAFLNSPSMQTAPSNVIEGTGRFLSGLREKMKYVLSEEDSRRSIGDTRRIQPGATLSIQTPKGAMLGATLRINQLNGLEVETESAGPLAVRQNVTVRFADPLSTWEFTSVVTMVSGTTVRLTHSTNLHFLSRRRYPRVQIQRPASAAELPFVGESHQRPEFVPAELTEIAGPGMRLKAPLHPAVGDRLMVVVNFDETRNVSSVGTVRRIVSDEPAVCEFAVELSGLSREELTELVRETNQAACEAAGKSGAPKVELRPSQAEAVRS